MRIRLVITLLLLFSLSGCVGLGAISMKAERLTIDSPTISKEKGRFKKTTQKTSVNKLIEYWGQPDSKEISEELNTEKWDYHFKEANKGFFAMLVIIPIPILLDDGIQKVTFLIKNDQVIMAELRYQSETGALCFAAFLVHGFVQSDCIIGSTKMVNGIPTPFYRE
ncbi:hypothetical protein [uncultured Psychrosphaera sp.]|uniref:hypothetical protein n=1 Tax=uncultured Psychrosphaera sp. TaxID=1403522 RepID=UPI0026345CB4|nr:hypothetical protein [uncultured Psychrosphaera sp.]